MGMAEAPHKTPNSIPEIIPIAEQSYWPDSPWDGPTKVDSWLRENYMRFVFSRDRIIASLRRYEGVRPGPNAAGIYFLGLPQDVGYVGKATAICHRLWAHKMSGKEFTHWWCITGIPEGIIDHLEGFYIDLLEPPLNIARVSSGRFLPEVASDLRWQHKEMCGPRYPDPDFD